VLDDPEIGAVVIATRHDSHAGLVCEALRAGKHVFVEKPLALSLPELGAVEQAYSARLALGNAPIVMVGFNRRFAPQVRKIKSLLGAVAEPKVLVMTVNAGDIPASHWTQDATAGGGRIIGEACHFIDLLRHLVGSSITGFDAMCIGRAPGVSVTEDKSTIVLKFEDGSVGTIVYAANGSKSFPKERLEVFAGGAVLQLDNFRKLRGFGWRGFARMNLWRQDKGQRACAAAFVEAVKRSAESPIPFEEILEVSRVTIQVGEALR
jgi:predicted dehydrogenase